MGERPVLLIADDNEDVVLLLKTYLRPLECEVLVAKDGEELSREDVLEFLRERLNKWQVPDDVVFIDEVPKTSVGKFSKKTLRDKFAGYVLPTA